MAEHDLDGLRRERDALQAENDAATAWGAAVSARSSRIRAIERTLAASTIALQPAEENIFGKRRGRFDETMARRAMRTLPDEAISHCAAMDDAAFADFVTRFNAMFRVGGRLAQIATHSATEKPVAVDMAP